MKPIGAVDKINADITIPGSKSYTNRALLIAALAEGNSLLKNPLFSDDTKYMVNALQNFGVRIKQIKDSLEVHGIGLQAIAPKQPVYLGNAGTAVRFLTTYAALAFGNTTITGNERMKKRPLGDLLDALRQLGVETDCSTGCPPLKVYGGEFPGGIAQIKGNMSSQYISSILMCAPYANNEVRLKVIGELTSKPYVDLTLDIMQDFGVDVENQNYQGFVVKPGQRYKAKTYTIESDASNASYFFAAAAITKGRVRINNLSLKSKQGDVQFVNVLKQMGCEVKSSKTFIEVVGKDLNGITIDMNSMPDVVQTLAIVALFAKGKTQITNVANLRVKETDRLAALEKELTKLGAKVKTTEDSITIESEPGELKSTDIETYDDHRMAMSFAIVGLKIPGIKIKNPGCVNKSFPGFWKALGKLK